MRVVIFGANGLTGRLLTEQALLAGHEAVAVTRRPDAFPSDDKLLTVAGADVHDVGAVAAMVAGADAVLSALGVPYSREPVETYSRGTSHIVSGMHRHGVRRLVVVSSSAVEPVRYPGAGFVFNRILQAFMTRVVGKTLYDDMRRMETLVRTSGLEWTIVRPGGLYELPAVTNYSMIEGHSGGGFTARVDLAAGMLSLLHDTSMNSATSVGHWTEPVPSIWESSLRLVLTYDPVEKSVDVEIDPMADRVDKYSVRGGTRTLTTRLVVKV